VVHNDKKKNVGEVGGREPPGIGKPIDTIKPLKDKKKRAINGKGTKKNVGVMATFDGRRVEKRLKTCVSTKLITRGKDLDRGM